MNNKKGVKLLATMMVMTMVFAAGFIIINDADDSDAVSDVVTFNSSVLAQGKLVAADDISYYIADNTTIILNGSESKTVAFYVLTGKVLSITSTGTNTTMYTVQAVTAAPSEGTIASTNVATPTLTVTTNLTNNDVEITAYAAISAGSTVVGSLTVVSGALVGTPSGYDVSIAKTASNQIGYYTKGAVPTADLTPASGETITVVAKQNRNVIIDTLTLKNANDQIKITNLKPSKDITFVLDGSSITVSAVDGTTAASITSGLIAVEKGTMKIGNSGLTTSFGQIAGVYSADMDDYAYANNETITATLGGVTNKVATVSQNTYVYGAAISNIDEIKISTNNKSVIFYGTSTYTGAITSYNSGTLVGKVDVIISNADGDKTITFTNTETNYKLGISATNTQINAKGTSTIVGSKLALKSISGGVVFDSTGAIELANGFTIQGTTTGNYDVTASDWTIVVKKESTIKLLSNVKSDGTVTYANIAVGEGSVYMLGSIDGTANPSKNITAGSASTLYRTNDNKKSVEPFMDGSDIATPSITAGAGALYALSLAQQAGYDITDVDIVFTGASSAIYTTDTGLINGTPVDISIDGWKGDITAISDGNVIHVVNKSTFKLSGETVFKNPDDTNYVALELDNGSELIIDNSNILMNVTKNDGAEVKVNASVSTYNNPNGSISVGYMREVVVTGTINGAEALVYGKFTVNDASKLSTGSKIDVKKGGELIVNGTLTVEGEIQLGAGSVTTVDGTLIVGTSAGGAKVQSTTANVTVTENGTIKVAAPNNNAQDENTLIIGTSTAPTYDSNGKINNVADSPVAIFKVLGTLEVRGTINADKIYDLGNVTINGKATIYKLYLYDGVTVNLASVKGQVTVIDNDVMGESKRTYSLLSDNNKITVNNVTGVTITESVAIKTYTISENGYRVYVSSMDIKGTIGAVKDTTSNYVDIVKTADYDTNKKYAGNVTVSDSIVLGKGVEFQLSTPGAGEYNKVSVSGTIDSISENSKIQVETGASLNVTGTVTVKNGTGFASEVVGEDRFSAAKYVITDNTNASYTTTYTTFENAIAASTTADDKTIIILGTVNTAGDSEIASGITVQINGTLSVSSKNTVVAKTGSNVAGEAITVSGTFTAEDFANDLGVRTVSGDVVSIKDLSKTWTSLVNALNNAESGATIVTSKKVTLSEDVTIPEGVTVQSEYEIIVKQNTVLTIEGTLNISKGTISDRDNKYNSQTDEPGRIIVIGVISVVHAETAPAIFTDVAGAHFQKTVGAKSYDFITNVAYAASAADEKLETGITIKGEVSFDAVQFVKTDKMSSLVITIAALSGNDKTIVNGDMKLVGSKLVVNANVVYNGSVTASSLGSDAVVKMEKVEGVTINTYTDISSATSVDYMLLKVPTAAKGTVTISSGSVEVGDANHATGSVDTDADLQLVVDEGATLVVPNHGTVNVGASEKGDKATMTVNGTVDVTKGKIEVKGNVSNGAVAEAILDIYGTAIVADSGSKGIVNNGIINVYGTLSISTVENKEGVVKNYGVITVGSKPTDLGADASITGDVKIQSNGFVAVYSGSVDKVTYDSTDVKTTVVNINGVDCVTLYGKSTAVKSAINFLDLELDGLKEFSASTKIYSDAEMTKEIKENFAIGDYEKVYFKLDNSTVKVVISVGTGMSLWIDGVRYYTSDLGYDLDVGVHEVKVIIDPEYTGTSSIVFNGQIINNGKITITASMASEKNTLSATGDLKAVPIEGPEEPEDSGMGITDYLLIVLVILAAILVVVVAIRMMRS